MNRRHAEAIALYVIPVALLLAVIARGLWRTPDQLWGMYANQDGMWAVWNAASILKWGRVLDLSPFNPLSGMGSLFLPNLPWLNPGAAALALPLPRALAYLASYMIYAIEIYVSIVILFRALGLPPLRSALGGLIHLLVLFPPLVAAFQGMSWYALAPVNAHLAAMCNFALAGFLVMAAGGSWKRNAAIAVGIMAAVIIGFVSAPVTFLTYMPVYGTIAAAVFVWQRKDRRALVWRIAVLALIALLAWLVGVIDYLRGTVALSARADAYPPAFAAGAEILKPGYWLEAWRRFGACEPFEKPLCTQPPVFYVHCLAIAGALIQAWRGRALLRLMAMLFLAFIVALELYAFVGQVSLLGRVHAIRPGFILWSAYTFFALFVVLLIFAPLDAYRESRGAAAKEIPHSWASLPAGLIVALAIPAAALLLWRTTIGPNQPPPPAHYESIGFLGKPSVRTPAIGAVTGYLLEHASLGPGQAFRGYVVTYLGDPRGHVRSGVGFEGPGMAPDMHADARGYLDRHFGNRFQEMDLWEFGIPTLEEYGQWITKSAYSLVNAVFSAPSDRHNPNFLNVYRLDLDALAALGIRFVISDVELLDPRIVLRAGETEPVGSIFLYELLHANVASYSPTRAVKAGSFREAVSAFKKNAAGLADMAVVFDEIPGPFQRATKIQMTMIRDGFRVVAQSTGTSLVVLPVQFSRCFRMEPAGGGEASLHRANGIQTLLRFSGKADVSVRFRFGLLGSAQCRLDEARELARLGL